METLNNAGHLSMNGSGVNPKKSIFCHWAYWAMNGSVRIQTMAEFLVYSSMKPVLNRTQMRADRLSSDIKSPSGRRISVRSTSFLQSHTTDFPSCVSYDISHRLVRNGNGYAMEMKHRCDLFVFCLYTALSISESILNLNRWEFYVLPASAVNMAAQRQKILSLYSLLKMDPTKADYAGLGRVIESIRL